MQESTRKQLNSPDAAVRRAAVAAIAAETPAVKHYKKIYNLHCHSCFSYNGYGFSPSCIAALARAEEWFAAGIVDFDVLDGVTEFLAAARMLQVRATAGIESRVYIEALKDVEINSPGEPGIAYHMGVGFVSDQVPAAFAEFAHTMKQTAAARTRAIVAKVNTVLTPVTLNFDADVVTLTPAGNVTERHVCAAYRLKAETLFPDPAARCAFWADKLKLNRSDAAALVADAVKLEAKIRAATMKQGGPGYVEASPAAFPTLEKMNAFTIAAGAIPTIAWLNGKSAGEADCEALLDLHLRHGAPMLNIIPDRNWNFADHEKQQSMVAELDRIMRAAAARNMPVIVGTEMNAPGLKLIDDFDAPALAPHRKAFMDGAAVAVGHAALTVAGRGYLSVWAQEHYPDRAGRNAFFAETGYKLFN